MVLWHTSDCSGAARQEALRSPLFHRLIRYIDEVCEPPSMNGRFCRLSSSWVALRLQRNDSTALNQRLATRSRACRTSWESNSSRSKAEGLIWQNLGVLCRCRTTFGRISPAREARWFAGLWQATAATVPGAAAPAPEAPAGRAPGLPPPPPATLADKQRGS